ncbi:MAG: FMN-binding glutamate synthase family protein [Nitrososphaerales archaeon]|nr:FMN-binding glutamate synthase family protein [Nitrososphaerales archaeon]
MTERVLRNSSYLNSKSTSGTTTRVRDVSPTSGMCPICIKNCPVLCEISLSAFRGREALYPDPTQYGTSTAGALKDFQLDWSDFNIQSSLLGVEGISPDSDVAMFPNVSLETEVGGVPLRMPVVIGAYGSTEVARLNWEGLAIGAALAGIIITIGENVVGMDPEAHIAMGKVAESKELKRRVDAFREFWDEKYGEVVVQTNVEDQRLGIDSYAISKLEVNVIERKWGQGAKAIGGETRLFDLDRALMLKKRGYLVFPDPEEKSVREAFRDGVFKSFERHSRVGIPNEKNFVEDIEWLREQGAKKVFLKTGAYKPSVVAFTMKVASEAHIDAVTFDGAGGGTGMSPVSMMDEMSTPTVYLQAQVLKCAEILRKKGRYVPDIIMAGGFISETQILKSIAMSNFGNGPYVKAILMARAPLTAVMKSAYFVELSKKEQLPKAFSDRYGSDPEKFFISTMELKRQNGNRFSRVPWTAVGLYGFLHDRVGVGLQQLMAGARKWSLDLLDRKDLVSLTERVAKVTGIPLVEEAEADLMERMLD